MKVSYFEDRTIRLEPETEQDKAWILSFARKRGSESLDWELSFDSREDGKGVCGYCEVKDFDEGKIEWEDLKSLEIHSFNL